MLKRLLMTLALLVPIQAAAVYFPSGIDWTNPAPASFVQSLYLNVLGRAPSRQESQELVQNLRRNDNRTTRLRTFESLLESSEYRRTFERQGSWRIYRAPDYNHNNGNGFWRYTAAASTPAGFSSLPGTARQFTESVALSVAAYYDAFCYRGDPCIDNPELARERNNNLVVRTINTHACADTSQHTSQFKWVAVNGTTYPRGTDRNTICLEDHYYKIEQLTLHRYDCNSSFSNCERNTQLDVRATRAGTDTSGNDSLFFRDGSRLAILNTESTASTTAIVTDSNTDAVLPGNSHACADTTKTTSRFLWQSPTQNAVSRGIGSRTICMDNYYYMVVGRTLQRFSCQQAFTDCRADPRNNLEATGRTEVNGNAGLQFANGTTVSITDRGAVATPSARTNDTIRNSTRRNTPRDTTSSTTSRQTPRDRTTVNNTTTNTRSANRVGGDCAEPTRRLSQFRWKSNGLSSWPDGVDGRFICLSNAFYEISQNKLSHYTCQANYSSCRSNPAKDLNISQISSDGKVRTLSNGDEITLVSQ